MSGQRIRVLLILALAVGLANFAVSGKTTRRTTILPRPRILDDIAPNVGNALPFLNPRGNDRDQMPQQRMVPQQPQPNPAPALQQQVAIPQVRPVEALSQEELNALVLKAIDTTRRRYLDPNEYTPWQIMHGVLALRHDYKLKVGNKLVKAIDYISNGVMYRGEYWFEKTPFGGRGHPFSVPYAFEGHINQFAALLCMSALPLDHKIRVQGGTITIGDIVRNSQMTTNSNEEVSWTLWFLTQYVSQDTEWVNQMGQRWSMSELVRVQVQDPVYNAPCGGTHGLFAIAFARNAYIQQHGKPRGYWLQADFKLGSHIELAKQLQNPDGSFSTQWFKGRGFSYDFQERIKTSGHMLEWLMMALPERRLEEAWVRRAIQNVANDLMRAASSPVECGPMYHALHALMLYRERMIPDSPSPSPKPADQLASPQTSPTQPANSSGKTPVAGGQKLLELNAPQPGAKPASKPESNDKVAEAVPDTKSATEGEFPASPPTTEGTKAAEPKPSVASGPPAISTPGPVAPSTLPPTTAAADPAPTITPRDAGPRPATGAIIGRAPSQPRSSEGQPAVAAMPPLQAAAPAETQTAASAEKKVLMLKKPVVAKELEPAKAEPPTSESSKPETPKIAEEKPIQPAFGDELLDATHGKRDISAKPVNDVAAPLPVRVTKQPTPPAAGTTIR